MEGRIKLFLYSRVPSYPHCSQSCSILFHPVVLLYRLVILRWPESGVVGSAGMESKNELRSVCKLLVLSCTSFEQLRVLLHTTVLADCPRLINLYKYKSEMTNVRSISEMTKTRDE